MSFNNYQELGEVLQEFQIYYSEANFMGETEFSIPSYFIEDLEIVMEDGLPDDSEFTICENLIYPVIKEVWKHYRTKFVLWSHKYLTDCENPDKFPEYILAKRSRLGKVVFDRPYLVVVDAKQDRFHEGWVQCLLEMIVAQQLDLIIKQITLSLESFLTVDFGNLASLNWIDLYAMENPILFRKSINFLLPSTMYFNNAKFSLMS